MRLGATLHRYCGIKISDPDAYIAQCKKHGLRAAQAPDHRLGGTDDLQRIRAKFVAADIVIAEIGGWANCIDPRAEERQRAIATVSEALATADELGAVCCINIAGSLNQELSYGPHPDNFSDAAFDAVVQWISRVLREVRPRHAKLTIESAPWTPIDTPQSYARLLAAVDNPALGVHLDPVNYVLDARTFLSTTKMVNELFDQFGPRIVSCHAKDIVQNDPKTVQFSEAMPGHGVLDYRTFLQRAAALSADLPLIIEHLSTEDEYLRAARNLRQVASELGVAL